MLPGSARQPKPGGDEDAVAEQVPPPLLRRAIALLRLRPFDTSTASGRSKERYRRAALTGIAAFGARGFSIAVSLIAVPLALGYLGRERYGLWMTISSVLTMLTFSDLGVGNGLLNALTKARGRQDQNEAARYVSSGFFALLGIAAVLGLMFAAVYHAIPWAWLFNVRASPMVATEAGPAAAVFVGCLLAAFPLGVVQRIRMAYQEGFVDSVWSAAGTVAALMALLLVVRMELGLPWLVLSIAGTPILFLGMNGLAAFLGKWRQLVPRISMVSREATRTVMATGGLFFVLQIAGAVAYQSDSLIVAQILGAAAVTDYSVPMKLFLIVPTLMGLILAPLWPAYGEAAARGDMDWVRVTLRRSLRLVYLIALPALLALALLAKWILNWWVGDAVHPSDALIIGGAVWAFLACLGGALAMFLNGVGILRFQALCATLMMIANIGLSIFLTQRIGVAGVVWGSVVSWTVFVLIPIGVYVRRHFFRPGEVVE